MNNVYFDKTEKLHSRNRTGMIRSYRTTRTLTEILMMILDTLLFAIDRTLDMLARPAVRRFVRGISAIVCIGGFLCLISVVESGVISILAACPLALILVVIEALCLRGN